MFNEELEAMTTFATDTSLKAVDFYTDLYLASLKLFFDVAKIPSSFFEGYTEGRDESATTAKESKVSEFKKSAKK